MRILTTCAFALLFSASSFAQTAAPAFPLTIEAKDIDSKKHTKNHKYIDSKQAHQLKEFYKDQVLFLDIRTRAELAYVGSPSTVDGFVSYMEHEPFMPWSDSQKRFAMEPNGEFTEGVLHHLQAKNLDKNAPIFLICRSGDRSAKAVDLLTQAGFTNVYSVVDGFEGDMSTAKKREVNGWKNAGLPWDYNVDKNKLYKP